MLDINTICARCSKFSGYDLKWKIEGGVVTFYDPTKAGSVQCFALLVADDPQYGLREVVGRLKHWGITREEAQVLAYAIHGTEIPKDDLWVKPAMDPYSATDY